MLWYFDVVISITFLSKSISYDMQKEKINCNIQFDRCYISRYRYFTASIKIVDVKISIWIVLWLQSSAAVNNTLDTSQGPSIDNAKYKRGQVFFFNLNSE